MGSTPVSAHPDLLRPCPRCLRLTLRSGRRGRRGCRNWRGLRRGSRRRGRGSRRRRLGRRRRGRCGRRGLRARNRRSHRARVLPVLPGDELVGWERHRDAQESSRDDEQDHVNGLSAHRQAQGPEPRRRAVRSSTRSLSQHHHPFQFSWGYPGHLWPGIQCVPPQGCPRSGRRYGSCP